MECIEKQLCKYTVQEFTDFLVEMDDDIFQESCDMYYELNIAICKSPLQRLDEILKGDNLLIISTEIECFKYCVREVVKRKIQDLEEKYLLK